RERLAEGDHGLPSHAVDLANEYYECTIFAAIASYSAGTPIEQLGERVRAILPARQALTEAIATMPERHQTAGRRYWAISGRGTVAGEPMLTRYQLALWWLALAVGTGQPHEHVGQVCALIDNAGADALLDHLRHRLGHGEPPATQSLAFPELYTPLLQAIAAPAGAQSALVNQFLHHWYHGSEDTAWYGNHERDGDFGFWDCYFGYWCLEAALVVRAFAIDDSAFRDHPHYPADLVR
uniref:PoNe immunity protein domain-containing protein n=1 Tax=Arhodomonas sp. AD133 TaxID=3415009 RepID=UPI003EC02B38